MAYDNFNVVKSSAVPLPIENVDTDQIIPARFLKATERTGFGDNLFRDWRYDKNDAPKADFVLNNPTYSGKILVGGKNFGSGSSREHAAWAIYDYGFRCVVSSFFADIFRGNSLKGGLLTIILDQAEVEAMWTAVEADPSTSITVDLESRTVSYGSKSLSFEIDDYTRWRLMEGLDDIGLTLKQTDSIDSFEKNRPLYKPTTLPIRS